MRKTFQDFASELSKDTCCYRNYLHGFNVTQESKSTSGNQRRQSPPRTGSGDEGDEGWQHCSSFTALQSCLLCCAWEWSDAGCSHQELKHFPVVLSCLTAPIKVLVGWREPQELPDTAPWAHWSWQRQKAQGSADTLSDPGCPHCPLLSWHLSDPGWNLEGNCCKNLSATAG